MLLSSERVPYRDIFLHFFGACSFSLYIGRSKVIYRDMVDMCLVELFQVQSTQAWLFVYHVLIFIVQLNDHL